MQPITVTVGPLDAANDDAIAVAQNPAGAGNLTLTSSIVTLDAPRRVIITSASDDSSFTFTVYGTTFGGTSVSENVTGANAGIASTTVDFETVTRVYVNGNCGSVKVGTNDVAGSRWVSFDNFAPGQITVQGNVSGTVNYSVQTTLNNPNDPFTPVTISSVVWLDALDANIVSESTAKSGYIAYAPVYARVLLNSGSGSASVTFLQSSNGPI